MELSDGETVGDSLDAGGRWREIGTAVKRAMRLKGERLRRVFAGQRSVYQSGGMRGELQVLFHGTARGQAQSGAGKLWTDCGRTARSGSGAAAAAGQYRIHGMANLF